VQEIKIILNWITFSLLEQKFMKWQTCTLSHWGLFDGVTKVKPQGLRVWEGLWHSHIQKKQITNKELISSHQVNFPRNLELLIYMYIACTSIEHVHPSIICTHSMPNVTGYIESSSSQNFMPKILGIPTVPLGQFPLWQKQIIIIIFKKWIRLLFLKL
jgi:hypothetical protein